MVLGRSYCKLTNSQITHNKKIPLCTYFRYLFPNTLNFGVSRTLLWLNQWLSSDATSCHSPRPPNYLGTTAANSVSVVSVFINLAAEISSGP
ncbi:hypothetical protein Hanom_Chr16g01516001 [Helianthus anomalus]